MMAPEPVMRFDRLTALGWLNVSVPVMTSILPVSVPCAPVGLRLRKLDPPVKVMALARVVPSADKPPEIEALLVIVRFEPVMPAPPAPYAPLTPPLEIGRASCGERV